MSEKDKVATGLFENKLFTSKDMWKAISSVAIGVFVITLIYARFLSLEKDNANQKVLHAKDIANMKEQHAAEIKNLREYFDEKYNVLEDRQTKQHNRQDEDIKDLQRNSHAPNRTRVVR